MGPALILIGGVVIALIFAAGIAWLVEKFGKRILSTPTNHNKE